MVSSHPIPLDAPVLASGATGMQHNKKHQHPSQPDAGHTVSIPPVAMTTAFDTTPEQVQLMREILGRETTQDFTQAAVLEVSRVQLSWKCHECSLL